MSAENVACVRRYMEAFVTRIQLFTDRESALAAAGLTPEYQEERP